jgi:hypothetical protein
MAYGNKIGIYLEGKYIGRYVKPLYLFSKRVGDRIYDTEYAIASYKRFLRYGLFQKRHKYIC